MLCAVAGQRRGGVVTVNVGGARKGSGPLIARSPEHFIHSPLAVVADRAQAR